MPILLANPSMISLGGGMPNPALFPIKGMQITLHDDTKLELSPDAVKQALQYSPTSGLPELVSRLMAIQLGEHDPPARTREGLAVMVGTGSQDLIAKAFDAFLDESTPLIVESPTYSGSVSALQVIGCPLVTIPAAEDGTGMDIDALEAVVEEYISGARPAPAPRAIYIIPTASNPSGATMPVAARCRLYACARRLNCLILEDDPYHFLQYGTGTGPGDKTRVASLLHLDEDRRVLRFDSFSKTISAGMRLGFATGPKELVRALDLDAQASSLHTSGVSQALALALLQHWKAGEAGHTPSGCALGGLRAHLDKVCAFYMQQRDWCVEAVRKHLEADGLASIYAVPDGGMFLWLRVHGVEDTEVLVKTRAAEAGVLMVPGNAFLPGSAASTSAFVRASFSVATREQLDEAFSRFAVAIRAAQAE